MSVVEKDKIDFLWMDPRRGCVVLTITDHLEWQYDDELDDFDSRNLEVDEHASILDRKLETYFHFIESGQLLKAKPEYEGLPVVIQVRGMHALSGDGEAFYKLAKKDAADLGATLEFEYFPMD
jgi:hypothetical protein